MIIQQLMKASMKIIVLDKENKKWEFFKEIINGKWVFQYDIYRNQLKVKNISICKHSRTITWNNYRKMLINIKSPKNPSSSLIAENNSSAL